MATDDDATGGGGSDDVSKDYAVVSDELSDEDDGGSGSGEEDGSGSGDDGSGSGDDDDDEVDDSVVQTADFVMESLDGMTEVDLKVEQMGAGDVRLSCTFRSSNKDVFKGATIDQLYNAMGVPAYRKRQKTCAG